MILENKLNITDQAELAREEERISKSCAKKMFETGYLNTLEPGTFETLKQCKASLIIEEYYNQEYTKAVIIKFDNKNEYRIHSYRAEEIKNKIQDNRIIIE